jgi:putative transposase
MVIRPPPDPDFGVSEEALFRFCVVSLVRTRIDGGLLPAHAVADVADMAHATLDGGSRRVSRRTVYRWIKAFAEDGLAGLEPAGRPRLETSRVLPARLTDFLRSEREADPLASAPELIRRAELRGILATADAVDRTTVWRAMVRMGLPTRRARGHDERDARRFSFPHRMQMVLCDGKHFRVGPERLRRVALFFLDDATRYCLHVIVGTSESTELFLTGVYECIRRFGLPLAWYLDNGPGFISDDTRIVFAQGLGIHLINGTAGYPEGHGKIERFNRTFKADLLRGLDGAIGVDPDCRALALRLAHHANHGYNQRPHESLGVSPQVRWDADPRALRFAESDADLRRRFVVRESRDVSKDNVIQHGGTLWEVPRGHARTTVTVHRQVLDGTLSILHEGRLVRLHPVDTTANAYARRAQARPTAEEPSVPPITAAMLAFERDLGPLVGPDGGFTDEE